MAWVAVGAAVVGSVASAALAPDPSSGGGGSSNAYVPKDLKGQDQSFLNNNSLYQQELLKYYGNSDPKIQQLLKDQFNNPGMMGMLNMSALAGNTYNDSANRTANSANAQFNNSNAIADTARRSMSAYDNNAARINGQSNQLNSLGDASNSRFSDLIHQQNLQRGNVTNASNQMYGAANQIYNQAFDPQQSLYNQNKADLLEATRAAEYARGIQSSPYGASIEANALGRFQNDWQNQQLSRQAQGVGAMEGANQSALGLNNSYVNNIADLTGQMNNNYLGTTQGGAGLFENYQTSQANNTNTLSGALARGNQAAAGLGDTSALMYNAAGQTPYMGYNQLYGDQNQALQNYYGNTSPYISGLNQLQSNALGYMYQGSGAQSLAFNQQQQTAKNQNAGISSITGPLSQGIKSILNPAPSNSPGGDMNNNDWGFTAPSDFSFGSYNV